MYAACIMYGGATEIIIFNEEIIKRLKFVGRHKSEGAVSSSK